MSQAVTTDTEDTTAATPGQKARPLRADAARNRCKLVEVAHVVFEEDGPDASLETIAKRAGVGIGTLYRHYPTRQALQEAVFLGSAEELRRRAEELVDAPDPLDALVTWLRLQVDFGSLGHNLGAAVMNAKHQEGSEIQVTCAHARDSGDRLLTRAKEAGVVRADVALSDVLRLLHGIVITAGAREDGSQERIDRMFDLVLAGLRP